MNISEQSQLPKEHGDAEEQALCVPNGANFDEWTSLIAEIEKMSPDDIEKISLVYDSFLSEFPLCYGYWRKYAGHKARLCTVDNVVDVYEHAVQSATYSVDLWVDYCTFGMFLFKDPANVRRLFDRGISFVGKDYLCNLLWDKYIEFEYSQKNWSFLAHIYIRSLRYPTKKLNSYYDSLKKLAAIWAEEIKAQSNDASEVQSDATPNAKIARTNVYEDADITFVIKDLLDPAIGLHRFNALQKYLSTGEKFHQKASELDAKIRLFESRIRRPYFHVLPLDVSQLENWHQYLDFVEMHGDFDWTVRLYERCLIPCANYPEFWMRYMEYTETRGGREIAKLALTRATDIFLKRVPAIHLFCARFKEKIGDIFGSRAAFRHCDSELDADLVENVRREANMEKRLGNLEAAFRIYEVALQTAIEKQKPNIFSMLSVHFSRYKLMVTGSMDAARDVLIKGIQHLPHCKLLIQELLKFEMMYKGPKQKNFVDSVVTQAICPGPDVSESLSSEDREDISSLYLEFVDHCGTIRDVMKAWNRHRKLFPHLMRPNLYDDTAGRQDMVTALPHHISGDGKHHGSVQALAIEQDSPQPEQEQMQPLAASPDDLEQSREDVSKQSVDAKVLVGEVVNDCQEVGEVHSNDDLRPPCLATLSLSPRNEGAQDSNPTTSHDCGTLVTTPRSNRSRQHNGDYTSDTSSLHSDPVLPISTTSSPSVANEEKRCRRNYTGTSLGDASTRVPASPDTSHPPMHPQNISGQAQAWQNPPFEPYTQLLNQHQGQPVAAYQWADHNMQQQYFAHAPQTVSQPVTYPQAQPYQYPVQSHVQYGPTQQGNQVFTPQMWHYYYQQHQQPQQLQTWNGIYYPQQPPGQQYGSIQYGEEYGQQAIQFQSQGQVGPQQNVEASGPSVPPHSEQIPPSN